MRCAIVAGMLVAAIPSGVTAPVLTAAWAQAPAEDGQVAILQTVEELTISQDPDTGERVDVLSPPDSVVPGDMLRYTLTVTNPTGAPVDGAVLTLAVPSEVVLIEGTATEGGEHGWRVTYSVDGGGTFRTRDALEIVDADTGLARPALSDEIDTVRWEADLPIAAGGTGRVSLDGLLS